MAASGWGRWGNKWRSHSIVTSDQMAKAHFTKLFVLLRCLAGTAVGAGLERLTNSPDSYVSVFAVGWLGGGAIAVIIGA